MMGPTQQLQSRLFYTSFSLDDRIRPDNPLRKIRQILDFSWVRPAVAELYGSTGNPSIDPIALLKLMLILVIEDIPSERELMRRLPERLDWLWFCQYDLDSELPGHSVLSKARRRWGKDVFTTLFSRILQQCIDAGLVDGSVLHIDSSLIQGDVGVDSLQPAWAVHAKQLYQQLDQNGDVGEDETADNTPSESSPTASTPPKKLSPTDPDARPRVKGSQKVIGYQEHRCVDDAHGIITATKTTDASVHEGLMLDAMLDEHQANTDSRPETMVGDKAYGQADNYKTLRDRGIKPCIPHSKPGAKHKGQFTRDDFRYDSEHDCYRCPAGQMLTRQTQKPIARREHMYKTGRHVCQRCPFRERCYMGKYNKRIYRHVDQEVIDWADGCLSPSRRRKLMGRRRATMEGSFADATRHGFKRARWRGLWRVQIQNLLITAVQNMRKLLRYGSRKPTGSAQAACLSSVEGLFLPFWRTICDILGLSAMIFVLAVVPSRLAGRRLRCLL